MYDDAPPPTDDDAPVFWEAENGRSMILLANAIDRLTEAVSRLAAQAPQAPRAAAVPPSGPPSGPPGGPPKGEKTTQQKRGGLIFITCKQNGRTVEQVAMSALGTVPDKDARNWSDAEQVAVIDAMKEWGWIEDRR